MPPEQRPDPELKPAVGAPSRREVLAAMLGVGAVAAAGAAAPVRWPTRLTQRFGLDHPFVGAGMGFVAMPELVAAVCEAGGLGVLGNGIEPPQGTQALIRQVRAATARPFGVDFLVDTSAFGPLTTDAHIDVCVAEQVPLVVFHMNPPPLAWVERLQAAGAQVWAQVVSVAQAQAAVAAGVDGVIAQGAEAGGHNRGTLPLATLLPRVRRAVQSRLLLAAGGIADGAAVAHALSAGADGVWVGTRLVASTEAHAHPLYKRSLVLAGRGAAGPVTTTMFGPEYPGRPYRVLRNRVVAEWAGREDQIPQPPPPPAIIGQTVLFPQTLPQAYEMPKFSAIVPTPETRGDFEEMGLPAGDGVARIHSILPVREIIDSMIHEACTLRGWGTGDRVPGGRV